MIVNTIIFTVIVALLAAYIIMLGYKLGFIEYMQVNGNRWLSEMAHCDFCLSWWVCLFLSVVVSLNYTEWNMIAVPFLATPLTRKML